MDKEIIFFNSPSPTFFKCAWAQPLRDPNMPGKNDIENMCIYIYNRNCKCLLLNHPRKLNWFLNNTVKNF